MTELLLVGFLIGVRHAFDADHLAAVTTLVVRNPSRRESFRVGMAWGAGHWLMLFAASVVVLAFGQAQHARFAPYFEMAVGVMLVALGADVIRRAVLNRLHLHGHRHGDGTYHFHVHRHAGEVPHREDRHAHPHAGTRPLRALLVGLVHGLAGSAALLVLSVGAAATLASALFYISAFGLGSMLGMAVVSLAVSWPLRLCAEAHPRWLNGMSIGAGFASIVLGVLLIHELAGGVLGA
jgi:cytochrome c biogenesis protein CcdA